jgi:hypothetical protein
MRGLSPLSLATFASAVTGAFSQPISQESGISRTIHSQGLGNSVHTPGSVQTSFSINDISSEESDNDPNRMHPTSIPHDLTVDYPGASPDTKNWAERVENGSQQLRKGRKSLDYSDKPFALPPMSPPKNWKERARVAAIPGLPILGVAGWQLDKYLKRKKGRPGEVSSDNSDSDDSDSECDDGQHNEAVHTPYSDSDGASPGDDSTNAVPLVSLPV